MKSWLFTTSSVFAVVTSVACHADTAEKWQPVAGTGTHFFSTAIVHAEKKTETGYIRYSTETVELEGDLRGRVLYHPTSVVDVSAGTLTNTGHQVFSGTVLGTGPVLLHDERFSFDVDLATGATVGKVFLSDKIAGPEVRCELTIDSTGIRTPAGDALVEYTGRCRLRGSP